MNRWLVVLLASSAMLLCAELASAQSPHVLDRETVASLAAARAPAVLLANRRIEEARALQVGAGAVALANPEVSTFIGPRWESGVSRGADLFIGLSVPFEVSGAFTQRKHVAEERTRLAERDADVSRRNAVAEALDLWVRARGADERALLEEARLTVDRSLLRSAQARRDAGVAGDGDLALARVLEAQAAARKATADHERDALIERLRARVGLTHNEPLLLGGALAAGELPSLAIYLGRLKGQPAIARAATAIETAESDAKLQRRMAYPVPRFTGSTGRDPDFFIHVGVDLPIPIYQRNQTNVAVAGARIETARADLQGTMSLAEAELRAAYLDYEGAQQAFRALEGARSAVDDAEHLATRGYELGQNTLSEVATVRREAATARLAVIDAAVSLARARIQVEQLGAAANP